MDLFKSLDWSLVEFLAASATLDLYLYKQLTWRISIDLPNNKK